MRSVTLQHNPRGNEFDIELLLTTAYNTTSLLHITTHSGTITATGRLRSGVWDLPFLLAHKINNRFLSGGLYGLGQVKGQLGVYYRNRSPGFIGIVDTQGGHKQ